MKNYNKEITAAELNAYARQQQQYANACHQLMENVLFHSASKWGLLSVRIYSAGDQENNSYLKAYYGQDEITEDYFEVHICDFAAGNKNQNIAEHFLGQLDSVWKNKFNNLKPENLFKSVLGEDDEYIESWKEFYQNPDYFGKHLGLRVFQGITKSNNGFFNAESHTGHKTGEGESYYYRTSGTRQNYVMPGTSYGILLPLKEGQNQIEKDATQEYGSWLCINPERLLEMTTCEYGEKLVEENYQNQKDKNNLINSLAKNLQCFIEKEGNDANIISINASKFENSEAELWVKAILIAQFCLKCKPDIVFHECTENFMLGFRDIMREMFICAMEGAFWDDTFQIALISKEGVQAVYMPGNALMTENLNRYISRMKGIKCDALYETYEGMHDIDSAAEFFIPFDVIVQTGGVTLFEEYVRQILEEDIQSEKLGCRISPTHMRLGSTIHINQFYEAELMFGNFYFISRFAFLMLKDIYNSLQKCKDTKITLYGYASYSETLLVMLRKALLALSEKMDKKLDVDYILLEREEEHREMAHVDRIRYGRMFESAENKETYIQDREYIIIVPINSTLKTHQCLISLLKQDAGNKDVNILRNYALILVGPDECDYWERKEGNLLLCKYSVKPNPKYFVHVKTEYQESLVCEMCFPEDPILEQPLIEVNAASTIPNQAFGIITGGELNNKKLKQITSYIQAEEDRLSVLKDCLGYGHMTRNDTHFLFYVKTEELVVSAEKKILSSLQEWKSNISVDVSEYHIIVAPMHYSNCQFVEMVNEQIFNGMAYIIRMDFNKDFRNNAYAKYSNLRQYLRQIAEMGENISVKFHYVDDNIITGRTFFRAKSLIESIVDFYKLDFSKVKIIVFERVFTLIDRNSDETRMQYLGCIERIQDVDKYFYCFLRIKISSLRNYGDSCVVCNLCKEAERLQCSAATGIISDYWEKEAEKFKVYTVEDFSKNKHNEKDNRQLNDKQKQDLEYRYRERPYRRLFTTHMIKVALEEVGFDNQTEYAARILLSLMIADYKYRSVNQKEAFEFFVSYLKVCSRPFLVFQKPVKEAVYDILLIIIECIVKKERVKSILKRGTSKKSYWQKLGNLWSNLQTEILDALDKKQQQDLILLIMKQLTELKSNYIIRLKNINTLFEFMAPFKDETRVILPDYGEKLTVGEDFWRRYATLIKKLTGVSSDTSKSMWLDYALLYQKEMQIEQEIEMSKAIEPMFKQIIRLENTTNFQDGIAKIYKSIKTNESVWNNIQKYTEIVYSERRVNYVIKKYMSNWIEPKIQYEQLAIEKWREELLKHTSDMCASCSGNINDAFRISRDINEIWKCLHSYLQKHIEEQEDEICSMLQKSYKDITEGYQFMNFRKLMCEMKWGIEDKGQSDISRGYQYSYEGMRQITCCLVIKKLCEEADHTEEALLERIGKIAKLAGAMLGDNPVQIWAEYQDCSEHYKKVIMQIVENKANELCANREFSSSLKIRKHYHTIGDNTGRVIALDEEADKLLNSEDVLGRLIKYGYYYEGENFLWQMGRNSRYPLYLYAKVVKEDENVINENDFIYKVRNLLSLSNDIEKCLFSAGKQNYLHEVDLANSIINVLNREKSYSHTRGANRKRNYEQLVKGGVSRRHDSLVLLSDLNVSRIYRDSLNKEFYQEQEVMSLLLALILNVKEKDRGIVRGKEISVYISKTADGALRILNETKCDEVELDKIKNCLRKEPINEESGITLWSLSACIKRAIVCCVRDKLEKVNEVVLDNITNFLKRLTEGEFEIKLEIINIEGNSYFSYKLPIFRQLYDKNDSYVNHGGEC